MKKLTKEEQRALDNSIHYWRQRANLIVEETVDFKELKKAYVKADKDIAHELHVLELKLPEEWTRTDFYKYNRLEKIRSRFTDIIMDLGKAENAFLAPVVKDAIVNGYAILEAGTLLNKQTINLIARTNWSGQTFSKRIWGNKGQLLNTITDKLVNGINLGKSIKQIVRDIRTSMDVGYANAERLARSEAVAYYNLGAKQRYEDAKIEYVYWLSARDERTCPICSKLDGTKYPVNEAPVLAHPNCRCTLVPVTEETEKHFK